MKRPRSAIVVLTAIGAILVAGCSSTASPASGGTSSAGDGNIAYSTTKLLDQYTVIMSGLVQRDAKTASLDMLPTVDSNADAAKQVTDFTTLLGQGVKGILFTANDSNAIKAALDAAEAKKVPAVSIDTGPNPGRGKVAMAVRVSGVAMGEQGCKVLGELLKGQGTILELQGALTNQAGIDRSKGFQDCMKATYPEIEILSKPADFVQEKATVAAQAVLTTNKNINGIFFASDAAYLPGVVTVMERLGRLKPVGDAGHIAVATIDGSPFSLEQVRAGTVDTVISQPMTGFTKYGLEYLKRAMAGEAFKPGPTDHDSEIKERDGLLEDYLKATLVTKENASDPSLWGNQKPTS